MYNKREKEERERGYHGHRRVTSRTVSLGAATRNGRELGIRGQETEGAVPLHLWRAV